MKIRIIEQLREVDAGQWNALADDNPFVQHEFLLALEENRCVGETFGWWPRHICVYEQGESGTPCLRAAMPLYLKDNSYGELVFDWAWADAYQRSGLPYYPKLVSAIPYTPATGRRCLFDPAQPHYFDILMEAALALADELQVSSLHCLFPPQQDLARYRAHHLFDRMGCQFHWHHRGYRDFEDFLDSMTAKKRKNIKQERNRIRRDGFDIHVVHGNELSEEQLELVDAFYRRTFDEKWGVATLNLGFFRQLAATMGSRLVVIFAAREQKTLAAAICLRGSKALYGRHWGSFGDYDLLHFELCYYQGIEYCIEHGLDLFEPGAQGPYKISRGFEPTATWSCHWIQHRAFREIIQRHVAAENNAVDREIQALRLHTPFKSSA